MHKAAKMNIIYKFFCFWFSPRLFLFCQMFIIVIKIFRNMFSKCLFIFNLFAYRMRLELELKYLFSIQIIIFMWFDRRTKQGNKLLKNMISNLTTFTNLVSVQMELLLCSVCWTQQTWHFRENLMVYWTIIKRMHKIDQ